MTIELVFPKNLTFFKTCTPKWNLPITNAKFIKYIGFKPQTKDII